MAGRRAEGERHEREFFVEAVASIEELERWAFSVQAMHPMNDKQARLRVAACYIKNGPRGSHFTATSSS
jgi:ureidoglycolate hydrolase